MTRTPLVSDAGSALSRFRLDGLQAVVTGASRGIGRACAIALAAAGADVALLARTRTDLESSAAQIEALGRTAHVIECDVTDLHSARAALARVTRLDIVVNNAGRNIPQPFLDVTEENYDALFELNVKAPFFFTQAAVRRMIELKSGGSIVNISSQAGHVSLPDRAVYCATKHALEGFTKAIATEFAPLGIRANTVAPTFIESAMTRDFLREGPFATYVRERIPMGCIASVDDVVGAVLYLASSASGMVTGTSLRVDGGWTAQ